MAKIYRFSSCRGVIILTGQVTLSFERQMLPLRKE